MHTLENNVQVFPSRGLLFSKSQEPRDFNVFKQVIHQTLSGSMGHWF
jgi:hypothetical protein